MNFTTNENGDIRIIGSCREDSAMLDNKVVVQVLKPKRTYDKEGIVKRSHSFTKNKATADALAKKFMSLSLMRKEYFRKGYSFSEYHLEQALARALKPKRKVISRPRKENPFRNGFFKNSALSTMWGFIPEDMVNKEIEEFDAEVWADDIEGTQYCLAE